MQGMEQRRKRGLLPLLSWPKILICVKQMWNIYNLHTYLWTLFLWQLKECFSSASQYFQFQAIASVTPSFEMFSNHSASNFLLSLVHACVHCSRNSAEYYCSKLKQYKDENFRYHLSIQAWSGQRPRYPTPQWPKWLARHLLQSIYQPPCQLLVAWSSSSMRNTTSKQLFLVEL